MKKPLLLSLSLLPLISLATPAVAETLYGKASFDGYSLVRCVIENPSFERTLRVQGIKVTYSCLVPRFGWERHDQPDDGMEGAEIAPEDSDAYSVVISDSNCAELASPRCTATVGYR